MILRNMTTVKGIIMEARVLSHDYRCKVANFISSGWLDKCWDSWQSFQKISIQYILRTEELEGYLVAISNNKTGTDDVREYAALALMFYRGRHKCELLKDRAMMQSHSDQSNNPQRSRS